MGKSGYKRFKKQEKAKVKLKGNKTLLPKGQNVTDTNFKVKKIIVKEQLKQHGEQELLTKKHLNMKELISRMTHYNVSVRQEAVSGMKELVSSHGRDIVMDDFSTLLQTAMSLTIDKEPDVRTETLKLLLSIFNKVTEKELSPLFPVVVCHLTCAMTHIEPGVRADSMRLLDTMLTTLPTLTAAHTPTLLPHFLDLISQRPGDTSGQIRTLSLHLDGCVTSEKWRGQVIGQLNRLFSVVWESSKKDSDLAECNVKWMPGKQTHLQLYSSFMIGSEKANDIKNLPMKEYAEMLLPLLLDTFIEAVPKQQKEDSYSACVIGMDTAALLQSIVEVILHIWNLLDHSSPSENLTDWFKKKWGSLVVDRLLTGRFPYTITAANSRKRQRDSDQMLAALKMSRDPSCSLLNLQLCLLAFLLSNSGPLWIQSIQYIERSLQNGRSLKPEDGAVLCQCLEAASNEPISNSPSLLGVIAKSNILNSVDKSVNRRAFHFLTSIAMRPSHHLHQDKHFTTWLDSLPALLTKSSVPLTVVRSIALIATRDLPAFSNSLDGWVEAILDNLPHLKVTGSKHQEGPKLVVGLVYWVKDWDQALVESIGQLIQQCSLEPETTSYLADILKLKIENIGNEETKEKIEKMFLI